MDFDGGLAGVEGKQIRVYCDDVMEENEDEIAAVIRASEENVSVR